MNYRIRVFIAGVAIGLAMTSCNSNAGDNAGQGDEGEPQQGASQEEPSAREQHQISDAQTIVGLLERGYAPREWKEDLFGFSFEERSQAFLDQAGEEMGDADFYQAIAEYLAGFHDFHVSFAFPSTLETWLPFDVMEAEGRFLVSYVNGDDMPAGTTITVGDELVSIDGEAPEAIRERLLQITGEGNPKAEERYATEALTYRVQSRGTEIPSSMSRVVIRSRADGAEKTIDLEWITKGWPFAEMKGTTISSSIRWQPMDLLDEAREKAVDRGSLGERLSLNSPESFFPFPTSYQARKEGPYPTGVMDVNGHKIGFVRIHTYSRKRIDFGQAIAELEEEIAFFEQNTEALIIDQTNNGGGSWCHTLDVASFFFDAPQKETHDQWRVNRDNVVRMEEIALNRDKSEADRNIAAQIAREVRAAMERGDVLTRPIPECNLDGFFDPHTTNESVRVVYTKPILMLVNELSVSCGDYLPAFFQDRGRAIIFGATTSGGGGSVTGINQRIGYSEFTMGYTISMGVREPTDPDGGGLIRYIENAGVTPDIAYDITAEDIVSGYQPYAAAVERAIAGML